MKKVFLLLVIAVFGLTLVILWLAEKKYQVTPPKTPTEKPAKQANPKTLELITANQQQIINSPEATISDSKSERAEKIKRLMHRVKDIMNKMYTDCGTSMSDFERPGYYEISDDVIDAFIILDAREIIPDLIEKLRIKPIPKGFDSIVKLIVKLNAKEAIPAFVELLKHVDYDERGWAEEVGWVEGALFRLGKFGNRGIIIPEMINLLNNENAEVRKRALTILERLNAKEAIPEIIKLLNNKDKSARNSAIYALGKLGAKEFIPHFIELLDDNDKDNRKAVVYALCELNAREAIPELVKLLKDKESYMQAVNALVQLDAKEAIPELVKLLKDKESDRSAAMALVQLNAKEAIPELIGMLDNENKAMRNSAIYALGRLGYTEVIPDLIKLMNDKDGNINESAMWALAKLGVPEVIPNIISNIIALSNKDPDKRNSFFRSRAAELYGELGSKDVIQPLMELLKDENPYVCEAAIKSLKKLHAREAISEFVPALIEMLKSGNGTRFAIDCLGELGAKEAIPALIPLLTIEIPYHDYRPIHRSASIALVELGTKELVPKENIPIIMDNVLYYSEDDSEFNRAINALKELGVIK